MTSKNNNTTDSIKRLKSDPNSDSWLCKCGAVTTTNAVCRVKKCQLGRRRSTELNDKIKNKITESKEKGRLTAIEFYAGIGGMHQAMIKSESRIDVLAAYDINESAVLSYANNFVSSVFTLDLLKMTSSELNYFEADLWTMSPPCQPYTRQGARAGDKDNRSNSFFTIMNLIPTLNKKPKSILIENVLGFETSKTHSYLTELLTSQGYHIQTHLINSHQLGIPNSRPRVYIIAELTAIERKFIAPKEESVPIGIFLKDVLHEGDDSELLVSKEKLLKGLIHFDVCTLDSLRSGCFTKSYFRHAKGSGSVLIQNGTLSSFIEARDTFREGRTSSDFVSKFKIRHFSPTEVQTLLGFPENFKFPESLTNGQQYKLLGNSLSVDVVACLISYLQEGLLSVGN